MADILGIIEVVLIGITAIVTVLTALYVGSQANRHFLMQRSTSFIERFNSGDMLRIRPRVDSLIAANPDWDTQIASMKACTLDESQRQLYYDVVVFANFFQELATAFEHHTVEERYTWDVFGSLIRNYWTQLQPFVNAMRTVNGRPTLYETFEQLAQRMEALDAKRRR